jgi:hypothetical protein
MGETTKESLDAGRDAAIEAIMAAREWAIARPIAGLDTQLRKSGDSGSGTIERLAVIQQRLDAAVTSWEKYAGGEVLETVQLTNAAAREPVQVAGATFSTAWEAAKHCAAVPLRRAELISEKGHQLDTTEGVELLDWADAINSEGNDIDYEGIYSRIVAEHASAVQWSVTESAPKWSKHLQVKQLASLLSDNPDHPLDTRTVRNRYGHAMRWINRQTVQIDINAVNPKHKDKIPPQ